VNATHKLDVTGLVFALDPPAIVKTGPTTPLVGLNWQQRRHVCEVEWPRVLDVPDPSRVRGKAILVYDDVFTDGLLLNTVARKLRQAGATTVCQVTLARQPWARPGRRGDSSVTSLPDTWATASSVPPP